MSLNKNITFKNKLKKNITKKINIKKKMKAGSLEEEKNNKKILEQSNQYLDITKNIYEKEIKIELKNYINISNILIMYLNLINKNMTKANKKIIKDVNIYEIIDIIKKKSKEKLLDTLDTRKDTKIDTKNFFLISFIDGYISQEEVKGMLDYNNNIVTNEEIHNSIIKITEENVNSLNQFQIKNLPRNTIKNLKSNMLRLLTPYIIQNLKLKLISEFTADQVRYLTSDAVSAFTIEGAEALTEEVAKKLDPNIKLIYKDSKLYISYENKGLKNKILNNDSIKELLPATIAALKDDVVDKLTIADLNLIPDIYLKIFKSNHLSKFKQDVINEILNNKIKLLNSKIFKGLSEEQAKNLKPETFEYFTAEILKNINPEILEKLNKLGIPNIKGDVLAELNTDIIKRLNKNNEFTLKKQIETIIINYPENQIIDVSNLNTPELKTTFKTYVKPITIAALSLGTKKEVIKLFKKEHIENLDINSIGAFKWDVFKELTKEALEGFDEIKMKNISFDVVKGLNNQRQVDNDKSETEREGSIYINFYKLQNGDKNFLSSKESEYESKYQINQDTDDNNEVNGAVVGSTMNKYSLVNSSKEWFNNFLYNNNYKIVILNKISETLISKGLGIFRRPNIDHIDKREKEKEMKLSKNLFRILILISNELNIENDNYNKEKVKLINTLLKYYDIDIENKLGNNEFNNILTTMESDSKKKEYILNYYIKNKLFTESNNIKFNDIKEQYIRKLEYVIDDLNLYFFEKNLKKKLIFLNKIKYLHNVDDENKDLSEKETYLINNYISISKENIKNNIIYLKTESFFSEDTIQDIELLYSTYDFYIIEQTGNYYSIIEFNNKYKFKFYELPFLIKQIIYLQYKEKSNNNIFENNYMYNFEKIYGVYNTLNILKEKDSFTINGLKEKTPAIRDNILSIITIYTNYIKKVNDLLKELTTKNKTELKNNKEKYNNEYETINSDYNDIINKLYSSIKDIKKIIIQLNKYIDDKLEFENISINIPNFILNYTDDFQNFNTIRIEYFDFLKNLESELNNKKTIDKNLKEIEFKILEINDLKIESLDIEISDPNALIMGIKGGEYDMNMEEVMNMSMNMSI